MVSDSKLANAVGGKTARACDNCIRKRARWYCAADDAFLCEACDVSVHSANTLARRHERVRLKTASTMEPPPKEEAISSSEEGFVPTWHHGFTRKARTPRHNNKHAKGNPLHLVPEIGSEENEENEEQLLYRVPIFDPFVAELCTSATSNEALNTMHNDIDVTDIIENKCVIPDINQLHGSLPSEMDLAQFAADVETLLGKGLDDESFDMEGLMDCKESDLMECSMGTSDLKVKVEDDEEGDFVITQDFDFEIDVTREPFELKLGVNSLETFEEYSDKFQDEKLVIKGGEECEEDDVKNKERKNLLRLDYDSVVIAWADQRCPWTNGERPQIESFMCWPYCMGNCGKVHHYEDVATMRHAPMMDGGREARVSRYREKRRTRLFSKKIRYEVRKLNAEKRPRLKGRFVKRSSFAAAGFPLPSK